MNAKDGFYFFVLSIILFEVCLFLGYQWRKRDFEVIQNVPENHFEVEKQEGKGAILTPQVQQDIAIELPNNEPFERFSAGNLEVFQNIRFSSPAPQRTTYSELTDQLPISTLDCHVCGLPSYEPAFILDDDSKSFVDSFFRSKLEWMGGGGDRGTKIELVILTYVPHTLWNSRTEYRHRFGAVVVRVKSVKNHVEEVLDSCKITKNYKAQYLLSIHCEVSEEFANSEDCLQVDSIIETGASATSRNLLSQPLPIRDCRAPQGAQQLQPPQTTATTTGGSSEERFGVCSMILHSRTTAMFLLEWLEYHYVIGVDIIILYIHLGAQNSLFSPEVFSLVDGYVKEGRLVAIPWNFTKPERYRPDNFSPKAGDQRAAYTDALHRFGSRFKWMAFIDDDEFLVPVTDPFSIAASLAPFEKHENLLLTSHVYSWVRSTRESEYVMEIYPFFDENLRAYRKSVIQPRYCLHVNNHECNLDVRGEYRETCGGKCPARSQVAESCKFVPDNVAFIAHYYYKKYHVYNEIGDGGGMEQRIPVKEEVLEVVKRNCERRKAGMSVRFEGYGKYEEGSHVERKWPDTSKNRFLATDWPNGANPKKV